MMLSSSRTLNRRRGFFLVLVLIVIVIATMAVQSFTGLMVAFDKSAYLSGDLVQARVAAESGSEVIRLILADPPENRVDAGGVFNNANLFQAIPVSMGIDGVTPCNFSVVAPALNENGQLAGLRFGLQNESSRLNVNALPIIEANSQSLTAILALSGASLATNSSGTPMNLAESMLMSLPGMTEDTAAAILDWLDEDDDPRDPNGCEADYYAGLQTRYAPTNGPLLSVEELLLVRGVTPTLLFGADSNRNGILDPDEQQRFSVTVDTPGALGWSQYLTIHGGEASKTYTGEPRVFVNNPDLEVLYEELLAALGDELMASYIVAYRIAGQSTAATTTTANNNANAAQSGGAWTVELLNQFDLSGGGNVDLTQILDLVGSTVSVGQGNQARSYESPFPDNPVAMALYLPIIMDALTAQDTDFMPGRLNINECPAELLAGLTILTDEQIQAIIETREVDSEDPNRRYETWLMTEGIVTLTEMRTLSGLLTCGGDIYRAQIVGYFEKGGASHRSEFIIDATSVNPKVVSWRDLTHLGRGFDLAVLGLRSAVDAANQQ